MHCYTRESIASDLVNFLTHSLVNTKRKSRRIYLTLFTLPQLKKPMLPVLYATFHKAILSVFTLSFTVLVGRYKAAR